MTSEVAQPAQAQPEDVDKTLNLDTLPEHVKDMISFLRINSSFDTTSAQIDIMDRILRADTMEKAYQAANAGTISGKDFAGTPFLLREPGSIDWKRSAPGFIRQGGFPFYAFIRVISLATGEEALLDCGGFSFMAVLHKIVTTDEFEKHPGGIPLILQSKTMQGSGFDVVLLLPYNGPLYRREAVISAAVAKETGKKEKVPF